MNYEAMKNIDIRTVDRATLVDIEDVNVDATLPQRERLAEYVRQIKNPYCYKIGKTVVKISFADTTVTLEDKLESYLLSL